MLISIVSTSAFAQPAYVCNSGSAQRQIEVVYQSANSKTPCEVKYTKGNQSTTPWNAKHQQGYCEAKAKVLMKKLEGFGWKCSEQRAKS